MHVYVIEAPHGCKIGKSANPTRRMRGIETQGGFSATRAWVTLPTKSAGGLERLAHTSLAEFRETGEWFAVDFDQAVNSVIHASEAAADVGEYGKRLNLARQYAGLSQERLAAATGYACSQANISKLETGGASGSEYTVHLALALGVSPLWLATGNGEMTPEGDPLFSLSPQEQTLVFSFRGLTEKQQESVLLTLSETKAENEIILNELRGRG